MRPARNRISTRNASEIGGVADERLHDVVLALGRVRAHVELYRLLDVGVVGASDGRKAHLLADEAPAKIHGIRDKKTLDEIVEKSLRGAAIWDELKDRLHDNAYGLSGGQQQRLCIARCLAIEPDVILMDEPTSALDPISTLKVEELIQELKKDFSIVIVTHNMQQAARISDKTAFFLSGEVVEYTDTNKLFTTPSDKRTEDYITGRFG